MTDRTTLRARVVPAAMKARVAQLAESDSQVKTLRYMLGEPRIWEWAHSVGVASDPVPAGGVAEQW